MKARIGLLVFSLLTLAFSLLFSATPVAWHLTNSQPETYPELLFAFYHLPTAVMLVADSLLLLSLASPPVQRSLGTDILWLSALLKFGGLILLSAVICFLPELSSFNFGQFLLNIYHPLILLPLLILSAIGAIMLFRLKRSLTA